MSTTPFWEDERDLTDAEQERFEGEQFAGDNPDGAAASIRSASEIEYGADIEGALRDRAEAIQEIDNDPDKPDRFEDDVFTSENRAYRALKASFHRGLGAAQSTRGVESSVRWGFARADDFAKTVKAGEPDDAEFTSDNDLLPSGHPLRSVEDPPDGLGEQPFVEGVPDGETREELDSFVTQELLR